MTITVTYNKRKYEWDKNRAMNGLPAWKSDKGKFVHSRRLSRKLEMRVRRESKARREAPREHTLNRFDPVQAQCLQEAYADGVAKGLTGQALWGHIERESICAWDATAR